MIYLSSVCCHKIIFLLCALFSRSTSVHFALGVSVLFTTSIDVGFDLISIGFSPHFQFYQTSCLQSVVHYLNHIFFCHAGQMNMIFMYQLNSGSPAAHCKIHEIESSGRIFKSAQDVVFWLWVHFIFLS